MRVQGTSNAATPAQRLRENAEHALLFTADGKSLSVWADDALAVLSENQRLRDALQALVHARFDLEIPQELWDAARTALAAVRVEDA